MMFIDFCGIKMSSTILHSIMSRVVTYLETPTDEIASLMRRAFVIHADETSMHLNGSIM